MALGPSLTLASGTRRSPPAGRWREPRLRTAATALGPRSVRPAASRAWSSVCLDESRPRPDWVRFRVFPRPCGDSPVVQGAASASTEMRHSADRPRIHLSPSLAERDTWGRLNRDRSTYGLRRAPGHHSGCSAGMPRPRATRGPCACRVTGAPAGRLMRVGTQASPHAARRTRSPSAPDGLRGSAFAHGLQACPRKSARASGAASSAGPVGEHSLPERRVPRAICLIVRGRAGLTHATARERARRNHKAIRVATAWKSACLNDDNNHGMPESRSVSQEKVSRWRETV